jgi:hypothetical protein
VAHTYTTNAAEVGSKTAEAIAAFGFNTDYVGRALGELLADGIVEGIAERSADRQCDGLGNPWPKNKEPYRSRKKKKYGEELTNYRTGQMLSIVSLKGDTRIEKNEVTIGYGTAKPPDGSSTGYLSEADKSITDIEKAYFAARQNRAFFQLDQDICDTNFKRFSEALSAHIANYGR